MSARALVGRALPWIVAGSIAVAAIVVSLVSASSVASDRDRATEAAQTLFESIVDDTESRIALEQSKLMFLIKGTSSWAATNASSSSADLAGYFYNQPIADRVPALTWVALADRDGSSLVVNAASSGAGETRTDLVGLDLGSDVRVAEMISAAREPGECLGAVYGVAGDEQVLITTEVAGRPDSFVVLGFVGSVFLSPALAHDGVHSALGPPGGEFVVVRKGLEAPASLPQSTDGVELSRDRSEFAYTAPVAVFGSTWTLSMSSGDDFLEIPGSSEHWAILISGLALAAAVLGLLLTRQRATERQAAVAADLSRLTRRYLTGFDRAPIGAAELAVDCTIMRSNTTMARQLLLSPAELEGRSLLDFVHPSDAGDQAKRFADLLDGTEVASQAEVRYLRSDGQIAWITESIAAVGRITDADRRFIVQSFDTTARRVAELELEHLAFNDPLTGLPNRSRLREHLDVVLGADADPNSAVSMLFIDIDRLKVVNDSLGHSAGDEVIAQLASRLADTVDSPHLLARFGGDEFVVVGDGIDDLDAFIDDIHAAVRTPIQLDEDLVHLTVSIGVMEGRPGVDTPESMLRDADAAMYQAKALGKNTTERFDPAIHRAAVHRLDLERSLRQAIERDEFTIHYQPVVDLETNTVAGFEALLRWEHPERGLLEPGSFIDVADEAGLLDEIDRLTLWRACAQLDEWSSRSDKARSWHLAVNCSPSWFHDARFQELLPSVLGATSIDADRLWIEVTENELLSNSESAHESLAALHGLGVNVAIDDFGTGFSSLSYLSQFHVDRLKIDQSFVQSLDRSDADEAIVAAVVDLASALGIPTVAEGTESEAQLAVLRRLGADFAQGYALSRPMSAAEVEEALIQLN